MLNWTGPSTEPWGAALVTDCQPDVALFTVYDLLSSGAQRSVNLFVLLLDRLFRRMLWGMIWKAFLKSTTFLSSIKWVNLSQQQTKLLRQDDEPMLTMPEVTEWQIWWWNPFFRLLTQVDELRCRLKLKTMKLKLHVISHEVFLQSADIFCLSLKFTIYLISCLSRPRSKKNIVSVFFFFAIFSLPE